MTMDWNRVEGNWKEVKGRSRSSGASSTTTTLTYINGKQDQLECRLQQRYGYAKDQAQMKSTTGTAGSGGNDVLALAS